MEEMDTVDAPGSPARVSDGATDGLRSRAARAIAAMRASGVTRERMILDAPRVIGEALGWDAGMIWTPAAGGAYLECRAFWGAEEIAHGDFARASREMRFEPGLGLVGRVWEKREAAWIEDVTALPDYVRIGPARREGLRSTYITPLEWDGELSGVMEFYSRGHRTPHQELVSAMRRAGDWIARLLAAGTGEIATVTGRAPSHHGSPDLTLTFVVDSRARIRAADAVAAGVTGRTTEALLGYSLIDDFIGRDTTGPAAAEDAFARLGEGKSVVRFRAPFATPDGPRLAEWTCTALSTDVAGAPLVVVTIHFARE